MLDQNAEYVCTSLFSSVVEQVFFCAAVRCGHALKVCDRVALLAVSADEMLHISARRVLGSARGAGFGSTAVSRRTFFDASNSFPTRFMWSSWSVADTPQVPDRRAATRCLDVQFANFAPIR